MSEVLAGRYSGQGWRSKGEIVSSTSTKLFLIFSNQFAHDDIISAMANTGTYLFTSSYAMIKVSGWVGLDD